MTRHVLISSMKNEGPFVLEWVAHHLVLGFEQIIVASNDCEDGTDLLLAALAEAGFIAHVPNVVASGEIPQHAGYAKIRKRHDIDSADWLMMLDADEFLNVHLGAGGVADLTARAGPEVDVIALNGMFFTAEPEVNWRSGRVCPMFQARVALRHKANIALKTLTRAPERFKEIHNHSLVNLRQKAALTVLWGDGTQTLTDPEVPLWKQLRNGRLDAVSHRLAQYNHYGIKTLDSFMLRGLRGRGAVAQTTPDNARHTEDYFAERMVAAGQDATILRYGAQVEALMAQMLAHDKIRRRQRKAERLYGERAAPYRR
ncbi:MAG: glycosyltransferase family 2 protein [Cypionkella sp.]